VISKSIEKTNCLIISNKQTIIENINLKRYKFLKIEDNEKVYEKI